MKTCLILVVFITCLLSSCNREEQLFSKNVSPGGRYSLLIYAYEPSGIINDIGIAKLVDNDTQEVLYQKKMKSVRRDFSVLSWRDNELDLRLFATWKIVKGDAGKEVQQVQYVP